jgi:glycosyltransferase involved in cell wall biosynthesis
MRLLVDDRWVGMHGIGRFAAEVISRLPQHMSMPAWIAPTSPIDPFWTSLQIRRLHPDVYFSPGFNAPISSRSPFVFTIHDLIHLRMEGESSLAKRRYYEWIVRPAIHKAHRVVTVSEFSKGEIVEWARVAPERILIAQPAAGSAFTRDGPRQQEDRPYLLYVGNRKPHKNIGRMLRAFGLSGLVPDVLLLLSGNRDEAAVQLIREAGVDESAIRFFGNMPDKRMASYYRGAVALLIPSLYEGFGLPALEAMACGTPVLAGNRASLPEVVGDAGMLVDPEDVGALANGIRTLAEDEDLRKALGRRGLDRSARFSWQASARQVAMALDEATGE